MRQLTIYDLNLLLQLVIFIFLLLGVYFIKAERKSLKRHRLFTGMALTLNAVSILLIMGRSFVAGLGVLTAKPREFWPLMTWIHVVVGGYAEISGAFFLFKHPRNLRLGMRITMAFWIGALLLGISSFMFYYVF